MKDLVAPSAALPAVLEEENGDASGGAAAVDAVLSSSVLSASVAVGVGVVPASATRVDGHADPGDDEELDGQGLDLMRDCVHGLHGTVGEQKDEAFLDRRDDADDDLGKGRIKFPERLYGREEELRALRDAYGSVVVAWETDGNEGDEDGIGGGGDEDGIGGGGGNDGGDSGENAGRVGECLAVDGSGDDNDEDDHHRRHGAESATRAVFLTAHECLSGDGSGDDNDEDAHHRHHGAESATRAVSLPARECLAGDGSGDDNDEDDHHRRHGAESATRAVFLSAPWGFGKSSLVAEFLRRIEAEAQGDGDNGGGGDDRGARVGGGGDGDFAPAPLPIPLFAAGKFAESSARSSFGPGEASSCPPLSGFSEALGGLVASLEAADDDAVEGGGRDGARGARWARRRLEDAGLSLSPAATPSSAGEGGGGGGAGAAASSEAKAEVGGESGRERGSQHGSKHERVHESMHGGVYGACGSDAAAVLLRAFPVLGPLLGAPAPNRRGTTAAAAPEVPSSGRRSLSFRSPKGRRRFSLAASPTAAKKRTSSGAASVALLHSVRHDRDPRLLHSAVRSLLSALSCREHPLVLFLDDLQWADEASLDLLTACSPTSDDAAPPLRRGGSCVLLVVSYRCTEVNDGGPVTAALADVEEKLGGPRGGAVTRIALDRLTRSDVRELVGDCVGKSPDEAAPLADAVFDRTLGNAFFVRQALEELVRKNVLYYDVMVFEWRWDVEREVGLCESLSRDVSDMLRAKIERSLPGPLTRALILAAYTRNNFDASTVCALLHSEAEDCCGAVAISLTELRSLLDRAVGMDLLIRGPAPGRYAFAHDKIREAAQLCAGDDRDRNHLLFRIATVLRSLHAKAEAEEAGGGKGGGNSGGDGGGAEDWMLFVAAGHMNTIPHDMTAPLDVARLNLRAALLARSKAAFGQALALLRAGMGRLDDAGGWTADYDLALEMHNLLLTTEFAKGNYGNAREVSERVLDNARSLDDMFAAHLTVVRTVSYGEGRDHALAASKALDVLALHGHRLPRNPGRADIVREKLRLKIGLRGRPVRSIADLPPAEDESPLMMLFDDAAASAAACHDHALATAIALRAMQVSAAGGETSRYLAPLSVILGMPYRSQGRFRKALARGDLATRFLERLAEEGGYEYAYTMLSLHNSLLQLRHSFCDSFDAYAEVFGTCMAYGSVDHALSVPMVYVFCYFAEGLPLHSLLEAKLSKSEHQARALGRPNMVVVFQLCHQFLLNLRGNLSKAPTVLKGKAFDEERAVETLEGNSKKAALRDINIFRLQLAVIFGDLPAMERALDYLASFPVYDQIIVREHLRLSFVGLAAFRLGRLRKRGEYVRTGRRVLRHFRRLDRSGSVNARPVLLCLMATARPGKGSYDRAIHACSSLGLLHLEALMAEHCGLFFQARNDHSMEMEYLERALSLYTEWGAVAKVKQLKMKHGFLSSIKPSKVSLKAEDSIGKFPLKSVKSSLYSSMLTA